MRQNRIYQAIDAVARLGSIRRAAEALSISPSALNRQILAAEDDIGAQMFERLPRGVRLSTAGEIYLRCFRTHLAEMERAEAQVADLAGLRAGAVKVGVSEELAAGFIAKAATRYQARHPQVDIRVEVIGVDDIAAALRDYSVDVAVAVNCLYDETIEAMHAETAEVVGVISSKSRYGEELRLSNLSGAPLIAPTQGSGLRRGLDAAFAARRTPARYAMEMDRLCPARLHADPEAVQFSLNVALEAEDLAADGLRAVRLASSALPAFHVALLRLRNRVLPVSSGRFAQEVAGML